MEFQVQIVAQVEDKKKGQPKQAAPLNSAAECQLELDLHSHKCR